MKDIYIIDGLRTPIGGVGKSLKNISAVNLASIVIKELITRNNLGKDAVSEVILGNAVGAGLGQNPARQALLGAGISYSTPAFTVSMACGSGLKSVILASQAIQCKDAKLVIAGGTESASNCPHFLPRDKKIGEVDILEKKYDTLISDGLWCNLVGDHMGRVAEDTAEKFNISRERQDAYALESHKKACHAQENGLFQNEIVPVKLEDGRVFSIDEKPRKDTSMEKLARVPSAFKTGGRVTAGNSPHPADGAAALVLTREDVTKKLKIKPVARILGYATIAVEPKLVFTAPALAIKECLRASSLKLSDIDLFEINEAFSVQAILTIEELGLDVKRVNVFGGTIALGHPLGASGARGLVTLINALRHQKGKIGITAICLGGGCAVAMAVEMVT